MHFPAFRNLASAFCSGYIFANSTESARRRTRRCNVFLSFRGSSKQKSLRRPGTRKNSTLKDSPTYCRFQFQPRKKAPQPKLSGFSQAAQKKVMSGKPRPVSHFETVLSLTPKKSASRLWGSFCFSRSRFITEPVTY
mgnify:CR=1 FL=1